MDDCCAVCGMRSRQQFLVTRCWFLKAYEKEIFFLSFDKVKQETLFNMGIHLLAFISVHVWAIAFDD